LRNKIVDTKNTNESVAEYERDSSEGTIEKGNTLRPERDGRLTPHSSNNNDK
jgi:hypothetical protein